MLEEKEDDIESFLSTSDFRGLNYSSNQFIYFLQKLQRMYKLAYDKYLSMKSENASLKLKIKKLEQKIMDDKKYHRIDQAKVENFKKSMKIPLTFKERLLGKLINRYNPD